MEPETKKIKSILVRNIKRYRKKAGLTQEKAAEIVGITTKYWQRLEMVSQPDFPSFPTLNQIAKTLKTTMSSLLDESR